ncbi:MAG: hypothetical protein QG568_620 [Patescibacteria group bacterium]|nr:hypothetical protein [Patescibacteria group bacterium]
MNPESQESILQSSQSTLQTEVPKHGNRLLIIGGFIGLIAVAFVLYIYIFNPTHNPKFYSAYFSSYNAPRPMNETQLKESFLKFIKAKLDESKIQDPAWEITFDESLVVCTGTTCKGTMVAKQGSSKSTSDVSFTSIDGEWINDEVIAMQQAKKASDELEKKLGTENRYSLSVLTGEGASLEVFIDGESVEVFKNTADTGDGSISGLLPIPKGKHEVEIRFTGNVDKWLYSYELKEYPKDTDATDVLFDDSYIIADTSKEGSGITKSVREKLNGVKSIKLQVDAK